MLFKNTLKFAVIAILISSCQQEESMTKQESAMYQKAAIETPMAKKVAKELTIHDHTRIDNYFWLKEREDPEVIDYLNSENSYLKDVMSHTEDLQTNLFEEMKGRIKETDESVPYKDNGYFYITRYEEGLEHPIYSRKKGT